MYTECPECQTTFRVTAQLLRQARGQVRCGDCGHTFDALDNLSEEETDTNISNSQSINMIAKRSRDLLKSLDELAGGGDVRIEDTGIEWRVLDMDGVNDDDGEAERDEDDVVDEDAAAGIEVDEQFDVAGEDIEMAGPSDDEPDGGDPAVDEQQRFDDDSPLPENFDDAASDQQQAAASDAAKGDERDQEAQETLHVAIDTGTESDWSDLLSEVDEASPGQDDRVDDGDALADTPAAQDSTAEVGDEQLHTAADEDEEAADTADQPAAVGLPDARARLTATPEDEEADDTLVESIIMEGDTVTELMETAERASYDDVPPPELDDESPLATARAHGHGRSTMSGYLAYLALLALGIALLAQFVHANRETLATTPFFEATIAPLYVALGKPVTPAWDVRGWQFESTSGSTGEADQQLTIYSRIVNQSVAALPYPLIHLSLTDRWDDVIGSRVLRPQEYLAGQENVSAPVGVGASFAAVITVEAPAPAATGFKLNVCYPLPGQRLRCAIEEFRD